MIRASTSPRLVSRSRLSPPPGSGTRSPGPPRRPPAPAFGLAADLPADLFAALPGAVATGVAAGVPAALAAGFLVAVPGSGLTALPGSGLTALVPGLMSVLAVSDLAVSDLARGAGFAGGRAPVVDAGAAGERGDGWGRRRGPPPPALHSLPRARGKARRPM